MTDRSELHQHPLFTATERWGWQFVPAVSPQASPLSGSKPEWVEPKPPAVVRVEQQLGGSTHWLAQSLLAAVLFGVFSMVVVALLGRSTVAAALVLIGGALVVRHCVKLYGVHRAIARAKQRWAMNRADKWAEHQQRLREWEHAVEQHNAQEQERFGHEPLWYPVQPDRSPPRIDVCGGTVDGWACLLTTVGASFLAGGSKLVLVDLTGDDVGAELRALANRAGYRCAATNVRCSGPGPDVFGGLRRHQVVDALALSVREATGKIDDDQLGEAHALDTEVLELAVACLDGRYSIRRIVAALTFLARPQDGAAAVELTDGELQQLAAKTDILASDNELRRRLSVILARLRPLRTVEVDETHLPFVRDNGANDVDSVVLEQATHTQTTAMRRVLFNALAMRLDALAGDDRVVIVAGADEASHLSLERLSREALRSGIRLVLLFEHLRGAVTRVLGGDGSATLLMRLGNTEEAAAAAEYVGRGHRFVLSQITYSVSETLTDTVGTSETWQDGVSDSTGDSTGETRTRSLMPNSSTSTTTSTTVSTSRSYSWGQTRSLAEAVSEQSGQTLARSYEFTVEPAQFQSLPLTAFIAVMRNGYDDLVVAADCNPGIVDLQRVATRPYDRA